MTSPLLLADILPGRVVRLDTALLRDLSSSETNAVQQGDTDRAVTDVNDFLVVAVDAAAARCTAVPLFPRSAVGNQPLDDAKKSGGDEAWRASPTYFSRWQHWRIPLAGVIAAAVSDAATDGERRGYALGDTSTLDDIRNWEHQNRAAYRLLTR